MLAKPGKPTTTRYTDADLYRAKLYSFNCYGIYTVSSNHKHEADYLADRLGSCFGVRSQLIYLTEMSPQTRENAIGRINSMIKVVKIEMDDDPVSRELQIAAASPALVYNEPAGNDEHKREEKAIKREKWSCYGLTEVRMLIVEEETTGTEHIAAILPINEGLSLRKIGTNDENFLTIGVCRNVFVCRGTPVESSFDDDKMQRDRVRGQNQSTLTGLQDLHYDSSSTAAFKPPSREEVKKYLTKMYNFSLLTGEHLKYNVDWLAETFQDEFPSRCWSAGSKIVAEMPKTALGTAMFMRKVYDRWAKDDRKNWR